MDPSVIDAMRRWPNVPAVYGWLSLTARGDWRLHPLGDAAQGGPGEGISNEQILAFINRNYAADNDGAWFFQNGPQRVFVRLDAAPLILRVSADSGQLETHHGMNVLAIRHWWLDDQGRLFAQTDMGPGMMDDRDLLMISERLRNQQGITMVDWMEHIMADDARPDHALLSAQWTDTEGQLTATLEPAPLALIPADQVASRLGFVANPDLPPNEQLRP